MKIKSLAIAISSALLISTGAIAQDHDQNEHQSQYEQHNQMAQQQHQEQVEINHEILESFVDSMYEVQNIQEEYSQMMDRADDQEQVQMIQAEAQERIIGSIQENGLTVQEYNEIQQIAQTDQDLMNQITELYEERVSRG